MATSSLVSQYSEEQRKTIVHRGCLSSHLAGVKDQLLIVSVIGPYQRGKSSFISHFTGERLVTIGNGTQEQTKGVWLYGPYSLNALKERWGVATVEGDSTKVAFVDTEGFGGEAGQSNDENRILMCELIAPYLAISQVCILMHSANIDRATQETLKYFLEVTQRICSGANSGEHGEGNMKIVDLSISVGRYSTGEQDEDGNDVQVRYRPDTDPQKFEGASQYLRSIQSRRFGMDGTHHLLVDKFWPLPVFNAENPISQQSETFNCGFKLVSQGLLSVLDEIRAIHSISGESAFEAFELFEKSAESEKFQELAKKARQLAELSTAERIMAPFLEAMVEKWKSRIGERANYLLDQIAAGNVKSLDDHEMGLAGMLSAAKEEIECFSGISQAMKASEQWKARVSAVEKELQDLVSEHKKVYFESRRDGQKRLISCRLQNALKKVACVLKERVFRMVDGKRKLEEVSLDEIRTSLEGAVNDELERINKEINPEQCVRTECELCVRDDLNNIHSALNDVALNIVAVNQKNWDEFWSRIATSVATTLLKVSVQALAI